MNKREASPVRKALGVVMASAVLLGYFAPGAQTLRTLPEKLSLTTGQQCRVHLGALHLQGAGDSVSVAASEDETLKSRGVVDITADAQGETALVLSFLGIPLKTAQVKVAEEKRLIPGGSAIGVAIRTDGVLVVGTADVPGGGSPAEDSGIRPGDVIDMVDGVKISGADHLARLVEDSGGKALHLMCRRGEKAFEAIMTPLQDESAGAARMGAWVRDSTAGVGTLSYYDPETGAYAALGHGITDGDTGQILSVGEGQVLRARIVAVQKGQIGTPGELKGSFLREAETLGTVEDNNALGIYGHLDVPAQSVLYPDGLPVGLHSGVHTGEATILSTVDGEGVKEYTVEITRVNPQNAASNKNMVLHITDERLLDKTGGIVQGMSGSPIIQDGKIIGAVTHVLVNDPTRGYGIFIENMLGAAG